MDPMDTTNDSTDMMEHPFDSTDKSVDAKAMVDYLMASFSSRDERIVDVERVADSVISCIAVTELIGLCTISLDYTDSTDGIPIICAQRHEFIEPIFVSPDDLDDLDWDNLYDIITSVLYAINSHVDESTDDTVPAEKPKLLGTSTNMVPVPTAPGYWMSSESGYWMSSNENPHDDANDDTNDDFHLDDDDHVTRMTK